MPNTPHSLMTFLRTVAGAWHDDPRDDAELLARFVDGRDEVAFQTMVWRHGPMVWQTCQRVLKNIPDTEDAFQVTFLALARKASRLRRQPLGGWLHLVARRTALNVYLNVKRRRSLEHQPHPALQSKDVNVDNTDLYAPLEEELAKLPEKLRVPLVLRYLEEKTQDEVARVLNCSRRAIQKRLERGEMILRERLKQRGLTLGTASIATLLGNTAGAPALPAGLIAHTTRAALAFRSGSLSGTSAEAAEKLLRSLSLKGATRGWWVVMASCFLGLGGMSGLVAWKMCGNDSKAPVSNVGVTSETVKTEASAASHNKRVDCYGDPLPDGAVARIGTIRFRGPGSGFNPDRKIENSWIMGKIAVSPNGTYLASTHSVGTHGNGKAWGDNDQKGSVRFWDVATGKELYEVVKSTGCHVAFSANSKLVAVASDNETDGVQLLDVATGKPSGDPLLGVWPVVFSPDNKTIVCRDRLGNGTNLNFYDVDTRKLIQPLPLAFDPFFVIFSPDGRSIACGERFLGGGRKIALHLLDTQSSEEFAVLKGSEDLILAYTPHGHLVTGEADKTIRICDSKSGKELRQLGTMAEIPLLVAPLPDGKTILAACPGQIRCWDMTTGKETKPALACPKLLWPLILTPDGTRLIDRVQDVLRIWDVANGREVDSATGAPPIQINRLAFSTDGKILATSGRILSIVGGNNSPKHCEIRLWDTTTGTPLGSIKVPSLGNETGISELTWLSHNILTAQAYGFTVTDDLILNSQLLRWTNVTSGKYTAEPEMYTDGLTLLQDGHALACLNDKGVSFLDLTNKKTTFNTRDAYVGQSPSDVLQRLENKIVYFSADQRLMATQLPNQPTVALFDVSMGRRLYSLDISLSPLPLSPEGEPQYDQIVGLTPDNRLVVTQSPNLSGNQTIRLWEPASGRVRLCLSPPLGWVYAKNNIAISPDSRLLATGFMTGAKEEERSIRIWDLATGQEWQCLRGHHAWGGDAGAPVVAFSPDGRYLASAGQDYTAIVWKVKSPPHEKARKPFDQKEMQSLKAALTGIDAMAAHRAIWKLQQVPDQAISLVAECLQHQAFTPEESKRTVREVNHLLDDLNSDDFLTRKKATEELRKKLKAETDDQLVQVTLHQALAKKATVDMINTIMRLLAELPAEKKLGGAGSPELVRMLRGIEVLELIHNDMARELLQKLVATPSRPEIQWEAKAALQRLSKSIPAS